jgi:hypothetical protein
MQMTCLLVDMQGGPERAGKARQGTEGPGSRATSCARAAWLLHTYKRGADRKNNWEIVYFPPVGQTAPSICLASAVTSGHQAATTPPTDRPDKPAAV